jgi:short-subunit dehydrogenase
MGGRKIRGAVVVITGASSGIGRATALEFARQGAALVLAARREAPLREVAACCERMGAQALAVPTDVTDEAAVQRLSEAALSHFGRIDVWLNNAGVSLFARFEEAPSDAFRQVLETNFFGCVHGARAALPVFHEQGQGVLINMSSVVGKVGAPYISAYVSSKFAIVGLSESLRAELRDTPGIQVCTVLPASIDTPIFQQAANFTGRAIKPLEPVTDAGRVARAIVRCARHPRREVVVGRSGKRISAMVSIAPGLTERALASQVEKDHFQRGRSAPPSAGNLFTPQPEWPQVSGGWRGLARGDGVKRAGRKVAKGVAVAAALSVPAYVGLRMLGGGRRRRGFWATWLG